MGNLVEDFELSIEIAGYARISVDTELDKDNSSIENQYDFIQDYAKTHFPKCNLTLYNDRDKSGYTFDQRENYQKLRSKLMSGEIKILIVKDFSRFSRRNSLGLYELELLRDAGVRIISITDNIDFPNNDEWLQIQLKFLLNEQPVTDASKKVKAVVNRKQSKGEWLCAVPYGYIITNYQKLIIEIVPDEAEIIREIFKLYNSGWGYKKIANHLTELNIPTPRMKEQERAEAAGNDYKIKTKKEWSIVTISGILSNDFYIGTFRQHKYQRKKINGADIKVAEEDNIVFQKHHEPIIDDRTFFYTQEQLKQRSRTNYRGIRKHRTDYSGFLFCGDCGNPMFSHSRTDMPPAYMCGAYHRRGKKACSAHHIRVDFLDNVLKDYIKLVKMNSNFMIEELKSSIATEASAVKENEAIIELLQAKLENTKEELKATKKRKIKDIMKHPESEEVIEETYNEIETELTEKIYGLENQLKINSDKRNTIINLNRAAKTVFDVFDNILNKERLDKVDIGLIIDKIMVYENNHVDIVLKPDISYLLKNGTLPYEEINVNFNYDSIDISSMTTQYIFKSRNNRDKAYTVNIINEGDPLEIFVDHDGEVILKKYSPIGELGEFAQEYADSLFEATGHISIITDRDQIIAIAGASKKDFLGKSIGSAAEKVMEDRKAVSVGDTAIHALFRGNSDNGIEKTFTSQIMAPIIAEGDPIGTVIIATKDSNVKMTDLELKLAETAASFLAKQMEQ